MSDTAADPEEEPKKKGGIFPLLIGVVLAVVAGGGGFFAVSSGMLAGGDEEEAKVDLGPGPSFVPLDPLIVPVGGSDAQRFLRFRAQVEVVPGEERRVTEMLPRITDVLNGYLRAVDVSDIEDPVALVRLRAQMLRRIALVVGDEAVRDLLVMEFVVS